jgi:hypothetical protein
MLLFFELKIKVKKISHILVGGKKCNLDKKQFSPYWRV